MARPAGKLTATQYEIMELVWRAGDDGLAVADVWAAIGERRELTRTTIQNLVDRLEKRRWLKRRKSDGVYRYVALADRDETARSMAEGFVDDFFGGSASELVTNLFGSKRLTREDLVELRQLLDARLRRSRGE